MIRFAAGAVVACLAGVVARPLASTVPSFEGSVRADTIVIRAPQEVRVVLASHPVALAAGGPVPWRLVDAWGRVHARGAGPTWRIERSGRRLRAAPVDGGQATAWSEEPFAVVPDGSDEWVGWERKRYRGELRYLATDTAVLVVNVLPLEGYLRGVVPLEIGPRNAGEHAAVEAQAIAARSYTVVRTLEGVTRAWDLTARATDQVYGGMDAESAVSDAAIRSTTGLVLTYANQVIRAPYHSTCGGSTAAPAEVFQGAGDPWLRAVSDRIPGTDRSWCDISPRWAWERRLDQATLLAAVSRTPAGRGAREVRSAAVTGLTPSGRVRGVTFGTDRGEVTLEGNALRFALTVGDAILPSTYFSARAREGGGRALSELVLVGRGNGHGVGMCQWGAIGRARAGMDAATILLAYFPGTRLARVR